MTKQTLEELVKGEQLILLLKELNSSVESSSSTCIAGG